MVIGNPPWATNAQLGALGSENLPEKTNFQGHSGLDALTGKSNFDISEWMLIRALHWLDAKRATMAMLCKTAVARKLLSYAWKHKLSLSDSALFRIDAFSSFGASVDACLLVCDISERGMSRTAQVYVSLEADEPIQTIGTNNKKLIASIDLYEKWKHLEGENFIKWRSGIKHDCSKVMELVKDGRLFRNGLGELAELEKDYLFPMMKSSEVANGEGEPKRWMVVTQKSIGEDTSSIEAKAPLTWAYLKEHAKWFNRRGSAIYKNRPKFSIFGVGDYSFSSWKVAISGFYKKISFKVIGPFKGKPVILDDTSYFLPLDSEESARFVASLLNSEAARQFFEAFIFWDAKRPITGDLLNSLDLEKLSELLQLNGTYRRHFGGREEDLPLLSHSVSQNCENGETRGAMKESFLLQ